MASYLTRHSGAHLAAAVFGGSLLAMALMFFAMNRRVLRSDDQLLHERITPEVRQRILRRNAAGLLPYAVATAAAALSPYLTLGLAGAVAVFYALPTTTAD
jgi:hypothetical protein